MQTLRKVWHPGHILWSGVQPLLNPLDADFVSPPRYSEHVDHTHRGSAVSPMVQSLGIDRLTRDQRIALVQEIWATIAAEPYQPLLTDAQRQELERRVAEDDANLDDVIPWEQVKAQALSRSKP